MSEFTKNFSSYLNYFSGREDYTAIQGEKSYYPINQTLDSDIVAKHVEGIKTFGVYVLTKESRCNFICIDIDIDKKELSDVDFRDSKIKFNYLKKRLLKFIDIFENKFNLIYENILLEETGGRGYHIWLFFDKPIIGNKVVHIYEILKSEIDFPFEFFPKQPNLNEKRKFGNLIKLPLGVHKKYDQRSVFFNLKNEEIFLITDFQKNIDHLLTIKKTNEIIIDSIIEKFKNRINYNTPSLIKEDLIYDGRKIYKKDLNKLYSNCIAIRELKDKALSGIELSHTELFHLTNTLLSLQDSKGEIESLLKSSLKNKYSFDTTQKELNFIEKIKPASCHTLIKDGICRKYCKSEFEKRNEDNLLKYTTPLHSQTPIKNIIPEVNQDSLIDEISKIENIRLAYYRLRDYHKNEDALFFDEFDFEFFEKDFDTNILQVSSTLKNNLLIPKINYEIVEVPKKIEGDKMIYRKMAYSSVFDQIIIQSVFNIVGELFESKFQYNSRGYRLNTEEKSSYNIFENWRDKYPEFRNSVLNKLREPDIKFYICCDIKGYYDNIDKEILKKQVKSIINDTFICKIIENVIDSYSFDNKENLGLPQGPAYARVLANLYLNDFDKGIKAKANYFFRYVDDFYVMFDSFEKAKEAESWIVNRLGDLGLLLSDDKEKLATIIEASDENQIVEKIDSVKYGIFEDFKFLPNLNQLTINEFYDNVIENSFDPNNINKELPTLIYFGSTPNIDTTRQNDIAKIVEELAQKKRFFPKKVKSVFNRLLDIYESLGRDFVQFYKNLETTNQIYFLIAVYEKYKINNTFYTEKIKAILLESVKSENQYLLGITIYISFSEPDINMITIDAELLNKVEKSSSSFLTSKLFYYINYFDQSPENKNSIDNSINLNTSFLVKKALLANIQEISSYDEIDNILIKRILENTSLYICCECCQIITKIPFKGELLNNLINFIGSQKIWYNFITKYFGHQLYKTFKDSAERELDNIVILFNDQSLEIKFIVEQVVAKIKDIFINSITSYTSGYNRIFTYGDCCYYGLIDNIEIYREIIILDEPTKIDIIIKEINELKNNSIILYTNHDYNASTGEFVIDTKIPSIYKTSNELIFTLDSNENCFQFLKLINNIYRKSIQYYEITGKIPQIENNIKINVNTIDVIFISKGNDLSSLYLCKTENIDNSNKNNIIKLLDSFVFECLFKTKTKYNEYFDINKNPKVGIQLFVDYLIKRLVCDNLSIEKISYLFNLIDINRLNESIYISFLFFSEKLKINTYKKCNQYTNWKGINNALVELYEDFSLSYKKVEFEKINYKNKLFLNNEFPKLNEISRDIINFTLNLDDLVEFSNDIYYLHFKALNLFGVYCLELQSIFKSIILESKELNYLPEDIESIVYDGLSLKLDRKEVDKINQLIKHYNSKKEICYDQSINSSLKEFSIIALLIQFDHIIKVKRIHLEETKNKFDQIIANLFINLNPDIELRIIDEVEIFNDSLFQHYRQPCIEIDMIKENNNLLILGLFRIKEIQKESKIKRTKCEYDKINYRDFKITSYLSKRSVIKISLVNNNPFNDTFINYSRKGHLWTESKSGKFVNIIIPDKRIKILFDNLNNDKLFGKKVSLYYHNKGLLIFDVIIMILLAIVYIKLLPEVSSSRFLELLSRCLFISIGFLFVKILSIDLSYWFKFLPNIIKLIKERN